MSKTDKLFKKLENGKLSVDDCKSLLKKIGVEVHGQKGSHISYYYPATCEIVTIAFNHDPLLPYQIKDVRKLLGVKNE